MKPHLLLLAVFLLAAACTPEEITVNEPFDDWTLLAVSDSDQLVVVDQPENTVLLQDAYQSTNGRPLPGGITSVVAFRDTLYFISPETHTIEVASKFGGYKRVATLDFSDAGLQPVDIAFPNATTGYIAFANADAVGIIDVTQLPTDDMDRIVVATVPVGAAPVSITALGNKLLTANRGDNTVSVVDSRTNSVVKTIPVHTAPLFIRTGADGTEAVLISAGAGKLGQDGDKTPARVQVIDRELLEVTRSAALYDTPNDSLSAVPHGLVVSRDNFAFVPLDESLVLVNTGLLQPSVRTIDRRQYHSLALHPVRNEALALDTTSGRISMFSGRGGRGRIFTLPVQSGVLLPY